MLRWESTFKCNVFWVGRVVEGSGFVIRRRNPTQVRILCPEQVAFVVNENCKTVA